jgi:hypothetical protein
MKRFRPSRPVGFQGFAYYAGYYIPDQIRFSKSNFAFGGMNVYVNCFRLQIEEKECHGMLSLHQSRVVSFPQAMIDGEVFDGATVHENDLFGSGRSADTRFGQQAADSNPVLGLRLDLKELVQKLLATKVADPVNEPIGWRGLDARRMIANEGKADVGMTNCVQQELVLNMARLGVFASKEFPARGKIEKQ